MPNVRQEYHAEYREIRVLWGESLPGDWRPFPEQPASCSEQTAYNAWTTYVDHQATDFTDGWVNRTRKRTWEELRNRRQVEFGEII